MAKDRPELLQGTLDLMVSQTLASMGALYRYGIARCIEPVSGQHVLVNQGTTYSSLTHLQQRISAQSGVLQNHRKAKFHTISRQGRKHLGQETEYRRRLTDVMARMLTPTLEGAQC